MEEKTNSLFCEEQKYLINYITNSNRFPFLVLVAVSTVKTEINMVCKLIPELYGFGVAQQPRDIQHSRQNVECVSVYTFKSLQTVSSHVSGFRFAALNINTMPRLEIQTLRHRKNFHWLYATLFLYPTKSMTVNFLLMVSIGIT